MVFDWFNRRPDQPEAQGEAPSASESSGDAREATDGQPSPSGPEDPATAATAEELAASDAPASSPTTEEDESLVWAREAYARLKAQQAKAASETEPVSQAEPASQPELVAAPEPSSQPLPIAAPPSWAP